MKNVGVCVLRIAPYDYFVHEIVFINLSGEFIES